MCFKYDDVSWLENIQLYIGIHNYINYIVIGLNGCIPLNRMHSLIILGIHITCGKEVNIHNDNYT